MIACSWIGVDALATIFFALIIGLIALRIRNPGPPG